MNVCACEPLVIHCFVAGDAARRRRRACASRPRREPEPDSVSAKAASSWPWASGGTSRSICSACRAARIGSVPALVWTATVTPTPASARESSSRTRHVGEEVRARAAVLLGHAHAHQPELAQLREDLAREAVLAVPRRRVRRDLLVGEAPRERRGSRAARRSARAGSSRAPRCAAAAAPPGARDARPRAGEHDRRDAFRRRPSCSKRMTSQPSSRATRASSASGLTATGWPTARSIGRSDSESRVGPRRGEVDALAPGELAHRAAPCPRGR